MYTSFPVTVKYWKTLFKTVREEINDLLSPWACIRIFAQGYEGLLSGVLSGHPLLSSRWAVTRHLGG